MQPETIFPFQISDSPEITNNLYHTTAEESKVLDKAQQDAHRIKGDAKQRLERYIRQYPHLPQLKNYLAVYYFRHNEKDKIAALNQEALAQHPDYLFARVGVAIDLYQEGRWTEMLPLLGEKLELNALYPERTVFHVSEVITYYGAVALYLNAAGKSGKAWELLEHLEPVAPGHHNLKMVENAIMQYNLEHGLERMSKWEETSRTVEGSLCPTQETTEPPQFENEQVKTLYQYNMTLPPEVLQQLLALPQESLIADLRKILVDGRARFGFFFDEADERETTFPAHALFLLAELGRTDTLPDIFELLRNGNELNDFYFGDMSTELLWQVFYKLGLPDTTPLFRFLKEPNVGTYSKIPVIQALEQLYYHQPQLQVTVVEGLLDVARHFLDHRDNETFVDTVVIADIAGLLWQLGGEAQKETIKALYDHGLVYTGAYGTYEELLDWEASPELERREVHSIYELYDHVVSTWAGYQDDYNEEDDSFDDPLEDMEEADWEIVSQERNAYDAAHTPFVRSELKVGRNAPCPCGSGKKYKKCCGKQ